MQVIRCPVSDKGGGRGGGRKRGIFYRKGQILCYLMLSQPGKTNKSLQQKNPMIPFLVIVNLSFFTPPITKLSITKIPLQQKYFWVP